MAQEQPQGENDFETRTWLHDIFSLEHQNVERTHSMKHLRIQPDFTLILFSKSNGRWDISAKIFFRRQDRQLTTWHGEFLSKNLAKLKNYSKPCNMRMCLQGGMLVNTVAARIVLHE